MRIELLKAYPNLLNAHLKYGGSVSIYIMKVNCAYMIKRASSAIFRMSIEQFVRHFECP